VAASVPPSPKSDLLTLPEVAKLLRVSQRTLGRILKFDPRFPKPVFVSRRCRRWRLTDVQVWLSAITPKPLLPTVEAGTVIRVVPKQEPTS
jgi:predicted DNA-binding transcriptional regulator AlpA